MAIRPETESKLWDDYPVEAAPPPAAGTPERPTGPPVPYAIAGALAVLLLIAGVIALTSSGNDQDASPPESLPFVDVTTTATSEATAPAIADVLWPADFGWEITGEAYYSGCIPGSTVSLPDGVWFGYVTGISATDSGSVVIEFDLACHYGIEQVDGVDSPFIENSDKTRRELLLARSAEIYSFSNSDGPIGPLDDGVYAVNGWVDGLPSAAITVANGQVVEIRHQPAAG